jgi:integrase
MTTEIAVQTSSAKSPLEGELLLAADLLPALTADDPEREARAQARKVAVTDPALLFMTRVSTPGRKVLTSVLQLTPNTRRAYRSDWVSFVDCCQQFGNQALPATLRSLVTFIESRSPYIATDEQRQYHYVGATDPRRDVISASSIRRALSAVFAVHRWLAVPELSTHPTVVGAVKMHTRDRKVQIQRHPLKWVDIVIGIDKLGDSLRDLRDKALVSVAHSTMFRRSELVAITVDQYKRLPNDPEGSIFYSKTKTLDLEFLKAKHLTAAAVVHLERWVQAAGITSGPLFRGVDPAGRVMPNALSAGETIRIFKKFARLAGLDAAAAKLIGGHSTRIGAAQDLSASGQHIQSIAAVGDWTTTNMVLRYTQGQTGKTGAMAEFGRAHLPTNADSNTKPSESDVS